MTSRARLMGWNGVLETYADAGRWLVFPERVLRSVRFGAHDVVMGQTMQIVPVRKGAAAAQPARFSRLAGKNPRGAQLSAGANGCLWNVSSWLSA